MAIYYSAYIVFRYASLAPLYYRGASAAVVVYDITNPETFQKAQYWVKVSLCDTKTSPNMNCDLLTYSNIFM